MEALASADHGKCSFPHAIAPLFGRNGDEHTRPDRTDRPQRGSEIVIYTVPLLDYGIHDFDNYVDPHAADGFYRR
jgi:hypothetical protein